MTPEGLESYRNEVERLHKLIDGFEQVLSSPSELARWVETNHGDHIEWVDELRELLPREGDDE